MLIQGQVGPSSQQSVQPGATPAVRLGQQGDLIASEYHGRYYETTYRKQMFTGVSTSATTTTVGTATTFTGLVLYNPLNSTVNLVLNKVGMAFIVAFPAAATVGLMTGQSFTPISTFSTSNTSTRSQFVGAPQGYGVVYASATLQGVPQIATVLQSGYTGAITTTPETTNFWDMEGSIILPPGAYVASYTSTVSGTNAFWGSFQWEEIPV